MFILLINYTRDVISESQRKGTAVLGSRQKFCGLLPEVVATGAGICDISATKQQNRVVNGLKRKIEGIRKGSFHNEPYPIINLKTKLINHKP